MIEWKTGVPGNASWRSTIPEMTSASPTTRAPAEVAGAVVPSVGIASIPTGIPAAAKTSAASRPSWSWASGAIEQMRSEMGGRSRSASRLPARTVAISTARRAGSEPMTIPWKCLTVLLTAASISWSWDVAPWSWALTVGHMKPIDAR